MSDDLLKRATLALRERGSDVEAEARTRARVLGDLHERERGRRTRLIFALPLAAIFVGSAAWAGASGGLERWVEVITAPAGPAVEASAPAPAAKDTRRGRNEHAVELAPASESPDAEVETPPAEEPAARAVPPESKVSHRERPSGASDRGVSPAVVDAGVIELGLYRQAHQAHFSERNYADAVIRYDAYLREVPNGTFAIEARYNRGLCLVRLGRNDEARRALEPFARGIAGGYRQAEAKALLDALD